MVRVGSARSNEYGGINGGRPGDQKGGQEVCTQAWYQHPKGWVLIRAKDAAVREKIAKCMQAACDNDRIGYCQTHRTSLTAAAQPYGYDVSRVRVDVETDCSELVHVCCLYAGVHVGGFSTGDEATVLRATGKFDVFTAPRFCTSPDYLLRGDILVTRTKGHTVVVLDDGAKAGSGAPVSSAQVKTESASGFNKALAGQYTVTASALNLRAGAGTGKPLISTLPQGTKVRCYGYFTSVVGTKWLLVQTGGKTGFCSEAYLKRE